MLKKVVIGMVMAGFAGTLIVGAINRTQDKVDQRSDLSVQGQGLNYSERGERQQRRNTTGSDQSTQAENVQKQWGSENGNGGRADRNNEEQIMPEDGVTLVGVVYLVSDESLNVEILGGEHVIVEGRAWAFAQEQGVLIDTGDELRLQGFYEDGESAYRLLPRQYFACMGDSGLFIG